MGAWAVRAVGEAPAFVAMVWLSRSARAVMMAVMGAWAMRAVGEAPAFMTMVWLARSCQGCDEGHDGILGGKGCGNSLCFHSHGVAVEVCQGL